MKKSHFEQKLLRKTSNTKEGVLSLSKHWEQLKIQGAAGYFWQTLRRLKYKLSIVLDISFHLRLKLRSKRKNKNVNMNNNWWPINLISVIGHHFFNSSITNGQVNNNFIRQVRMIEENFHDKIWVHRFHHQSFIATLNRCDNTCYTGVPQFHSDHKSYSAGGLEEARLIKHKLAIFFSFYKKASTTFGIWFV